MAVSRARLIITNGKNMPIITLCKVHVTLNIVGYINMENEGWPTLDFMSSQHFTTIDHTPLPLQEFTDIYIRARRWLVNSTFIEFNTYKLVLGQCDSFFVEICSSYPDPLIAIACLKRALSNGFNTPIVHQECDRLLELEAARRFVNKCASRIQNRFRDCISDPNHPICYRRLLYEFLELAESN